MEPTGSRSPRLKKQKKETASYFYINVQTKRTKGNRHQTMLPKQNIWWKCSQQQSHARWSRQVSPGQRLQLLSCTVHLTGGELIKSRLSAAANVKTTQNRCKRDIKRLPSLCPWHGSWENRSVIDLFFVIQREIILVMVTLHLCQRTKRTNVSPCLRSYTKEICWVGFTLPEINCGADAGAKHFEIHYSKAIQCSLFSNKLALKTAIFFKGNCLNFLHLSVHMNM